MRLIEDPGIICDLGDYAFTARERVKALGDAKSEAAKPAIAVVIEYASKDRPEEVEALEQWMKRIIPPDRDVPHHYLAARALLGLTVHSRTYLAGRIARAFQKVRDRSSFSGWFSPKATRYARNATFYHRPKLEFDL